MESLLFVVSFFFRKIHQLVQKRIESENLFWEELGDIYSYAEFELIQEIESHFQKMARHLLDLPEEQKVTWATLDLLDKKAFILRCLDCIESNSLNFYLSSAYALLYIANGSHEECNGSKAQQMSNIKLNCQLLSEFDTLPIILDAFFIHAHNILYLFIIYLFKIVIFF